MRKLILIVVSVIVVILLTSCSEKVEEVREEVKENVKVIEVEEVTLGEDDKRYLAQLDIIMQDTNSALQEIGSLIAEADVESKSWQDKVYVQMTNVLVAKDELFALYPPSKLDNINTAFKTALYYFSSAMEDIDKAVDKSWDKKFHLENALFAIEEGQDCIRLGNEELEALLSKVK